MAQARSDGLQIHYDDRGQGEPALLLMPGWCSSKVVFDKIIPRLSAHRRTLAIDWRGHGKSEAASSDFGFEALVGDALAVIEASGARQVVPVGMSHAGWVAIELRRRLGERVPKLVLLDWILTEAPPPFLAALRALQDPEEWRGARDHLFTRWLHGVDNPDLVRFIKEDMGSYGAEMWARGGREIEAAYIQAGSPLRALAALEHPLPVLHIYAQPSEPGYLAAQEAYAVEHQWFSVRKLNAHTHFPMFEVADELATTIERFVAADTMKELRCADVGLFPGCIGVSRGADEQDVIAQAIQHGRLFHGLRDEDISEQALQMLRGHIRQGLNIGQVITTSAHSRSIE